MAVAQPSDMRNSDSTANGTDDREARPEYWIAAYTRPKSEKKAAAEISANLGLKTYAPTQTVVRQWSDRKKKIDAVVIPLIVFIKVATEQEILAIKKQPLILKVLTMPGQRMPARIPDRQIEQLRFMLNESEDPVEFIRGTFSESDTVRVVRGRLAGLEGTVCKTSDGHSHIIIAIDLLGGCKAAVSPADLEHKQ